MDSRTRQGVDSVGNEEDVLSVFARRRGTTMLLVAHLFIASSKDSFGSASCPMPPSKAPDRKGPKQSRKND